MPLYRSMWRLTFINISDFRKSILWHCPLIFILEVFLTTDISLRNSCRRSWLYESVERAPLAIFQHFLSETYLNGNYCGARWAWYFFSLFLSPYDGNLNVSSVFLADWLKRIINVLPTSLCFTSYYASCCNFKIGYSFLCFL